MNKLAAAALLLGALAATPALAQQCGGSFADWKAGMTAEARAAGVGQKGMGALAGAQVDQKVLQRDRAQGVFSQPFTQFANRMISQDRLDRGRANLKKYEAVFARAERDYGVSPAVITAFWALETDFGAVQGDFNTLNALVTLAHDCRRPHLFRPQIVPLLTLMDRGLVPVNVTGAWAGEIGMTQMLPSDILTKGVDGDGDGVVDMRRSVPDVILTTANKIRSRGWRAGGGWMVEVKVPARMAWEKSGLGNELPLAEWAAMGVTRRDGSPLSGSGSAALALPQGHKGPAFLMLANYNVFLEWNQSFVYTLTAANLASRFTGAPKFDPRSPEEGLSGDAMKLLQQKLQARGHDVGKIDGILGAMTRVAVQKEQKRIGLPADGWPTPALLANL